MARADKVAARKARRAAKKENKEDKRAMRRQRRETRKAERAQIREHRKANKNRLQDKIMEKVDLFLSNEFDKIKAEYQAKEEAGQLKANPHLTIQDVSQAIREAQASGAVTLNHTEQKVADMLLLGQEIANKFKMQLRTVYEVAIANGYKTDELPKEVVIYLMVNALTKGAFEHNIINENGVIKVKAFMESKEARKAVAKVIAVQLARKAIKSLVAKFLPGVGAIVLGLFQTRYLENVYYQTKGLLSDHPSFELSAEGLAGLIENADKVAAEMDIQPSEELDDEDFTSFMVLVNLMQEDGNISEAEKVLFEQMLDASDLDQDDKAEILESLNDPSEMDESELDSIADGSDEAEAILMDMIAIAKSDSSVDLKEAEYIYEIGGELGFEEASIKQMLLD